MSAPTISQLAATLRAFGITSVRQMEEITTELLCRMPTAGAINGELSGDGNPTGAYYPVFVGQLYHDTTADTYYRSTGTGVYDWTLISGGASYQDMQIAWTPANVKLQEQIDFSAWVTSPSMVGITSLTFTNSTRNGTFDLENNTDLTSLSMPSLVNVTGGGAILILNCSSLTSISMPSVVSVDNGLTIGICTSLVDLNLDSFVDNGSVYGIDIRGNPLLASLTLSNYVPTNGMNQDFRNNALNQTSVDGILARCVANAGFVSGEVRLQDGTNSAPSASGLLDKATLEGRGVVVNVNP